MLSSALKLKTKWQLLARETIDNDFLDLCNSDSLIARLLYNRSVQTIDLAKYFIAQDLVKESLADEIPDMDKAFNRITKAVDTKEKILIFGDYDVDGTSSIAVLVRAFRILGQELEWYVPSRHSEGYGLNKTALENFKNSGVDLVISCDCGISNYAEVEFANSINLDVIVTDHHSIPDNPPPSIANCNPKTLDEDHPLHYLPGVGVAYKLAQKILFHYLDEQEAAHHCNELLDLVALGMVADLAPLRSENRYLTMKGLKVLARTKKIGLQKLLQISGVHFDPNAEHIGFGLAPRINAAGRLADAANAVKLMITEDVNEAHELAQLLDAENIKRQELCSKVFDEAVSMIMAKPEILENNVIVLASDKWHHGVIGIVASRLVERFHLPVFIMAIEDSKARGSVRSINVIDLDIYEEMKTLNAESNVFDKFGGHMMAAGFSLSLSKLGTSMAAINKHFKAKLAEIDLAKLIKIDAAVRLQEISKPFINRLSKLAPYGLGNPSPVFIAKDLTVFRVKLMGKEKQHLKLYLKENSNDKKFYEAVAWQKGQDFIEEFGINPQEKLAIAFHPKINDFMGEETVQLDIRDWKKMSEVDMELFARLK